ncbi:MAG: TonB family protein [Thiomargarita sp.]|nr:TonB family protein [Thiomargarita sp.]
MNTTLARIDPITERFVVAIFMAAIIHIIFIYGVGFNSPKIKEPPNIVMEIILVQKKTKNAPKEADYLGQASHEGGGEQPEKARPRTPTIAPFPDKVANLVFTPSPPQEALAPQSEETEILIANESKHSIKQQEHLTESEELATDGDAINTAELQKHISENLIFINKTVARLSNIQAELSDKIEDYSKRPRRKFINSSTKEDKYAAYMYKWCKTVEKRGTEYYRKQDNLQNIAGVLILDVAINSDGTVREINIAKPSKHQLINEAVRRIISETPAFMPFSQEIKAETDILHITRTWNFNYNNLNTQ